MTPEQLHAAIMAIPCKFPAIRNAAFSDGYEFGHRDALRAAASLVAEHLPAEWPQWPDIATAPRDGTPILLRGEGVTIVGHWNNFAGCSYPEGNQWADQSGKWCGFEPTQWCAVPGDSADTVRDPDGSPAITREWLVKVGGRWNDYDDWIAFGRKNGEPRISLALSVVHYPGEWLCVVNGDWIKPQKTQADFLRLAACLGVKVQGEGQQS